MFAFFAIIGGKIPFKNLKINQITWITVCHKINSKQNNERISSLIIWLIFFLFTQLKIFIHVRHAILSAISGEYITTSLERI